MSVKINSATISQRNTSEVLKDDTIWGLNKWYICAGQMARAFSKPHQSRGGANDKFYCIHYKVPLFRLNKFRPNSTKYEVSCPHQLWYKLNKLLMNEEEQLLSAIGISRIPIRASPWVVLTMWFRMVNFIARNSKFQRFGFGKWCRKGAGHPQDHLAKSGYNLDIWSKKL
jgi:hypothetical protein